jgi:hypothetical protein
MDVRHKLEVVSSQSRYGDGSIDPLLPNRAWWVVTGSM